MRYSYEFKKMCVEMYRKGEYPETPEGISADYFHKLVRKWVRLEDSKGTEVLRHKAQNSQRTPEERYDLVSQVLAGHSCSSVAISAGISDGLLYQWVRKYKTLGYNGLINTQRGRKPKEPNMKKNNMPAQLSESEREELIRLRAEIEYMKAENEVIKKEIALREEKEAARLKAKKQRSSKNFVTRDTN